MRNAPHKFTKMLRRIPVVLVGFLFLVIVSNAAYSYIEKNGSISPPGETWGPSQPGGDDTYYIKGNLTVEVGATLTIEPGTVVKFAPNKKMIVEGTLVANDVVFTSVYDDDYGDDLDGPGLPYSELDPTSGDWNSIKVDGTGQFNECRVRYGGGGTKKPSVDFNGSDPSSFFTNSTIEYSANYGMQVRASSPTITGSTFDNNGSHGLYVSGGAAPTVTGNTFTNNSGYGALLDNVSLTSYSGNTGSGNDIDGFGVKGTVSADSTWSSGTDFPFVMVGTVTVDAGATLTLDPGTIIKGDTEGQLTVNGTLDVNGTSGDPVIFTSLKDDTYGGDTNGDGNATSPAPGDWYGIYLNGGAGQFDWSIIRYGGNTSGKADANVYFKQSSSGYFTDSISEYSANYGVWVNDSSPTFRDSTIAHNDSYGIYINGNGANPDLGTVSDPGGNAFEDNGVYHLYNDTTNTINAHGNSWVPPGGIYGPTMVVLSSFNAVIKDGKVILVWRTESEIDNVGFAIYRSDAKGGSYTKIAFVNGAQDSETSNDYQFTDKQAKPGHTYYYYLEDVDLSGKRTKSDVIQIILPMPPSVALPTQTEPEILPEQNSLLANYPNPFNPETWIPYKLAEAADVTIQIYDVRGRLVRTFHPGHQPAGFYLGKDKAAHWDGRDDTGEQVGSGVYFYRLSVGNFSAIRKMVVLK